jgi:hypothetical protein
VASIFSTTLGPNEKEITKPTAAQLQAIDNMRIPDWVSRERDVKVVEVTDPTTQDKEIQYRIWRATPAFLLRDKIKTVKAESKVINRIRRVDKGETLELKAPSGERLFFKVVRTGTLVVYLHKRRDTGKDVLVMGGNAILEPDEDLYFGFNESKWHPKGLPVEEPE